MKILALDMATKTGWWCNSPLAGGVENFKVRQGDSRGMLFLRFRTWINEMLIRVKPELVVYEEAHRHGKASSEVALGLLSHLQAACEENGGVQYTYCHTNTLKKFATGRGNADKSDMMKAYRERWHHEPQDDNESDARWLLTWAEHEHGGAA
jgi:Holliday junction resolvasome RuvABC endonuclease subunit